MKLSTFAMKKMASTIHQQGKKGRGGIIV